MSDCNVCSLKNVQPEHFNKRRHKINAFLKQFSEHRNTILNNRISNVSITCSVITSLGSEFDNKQIKVKISTKPNEKVEFKFSVSAESQTDDLKQIDVCLVHSEFNFVLENAPNKNQIKHTMAPRTSGNGLLEDVVVSFSSPDIGQYETSVIFGVDGINIMKEMVVFVETSPTKHNLISNPFAMKEVWAKKIIKADTVDENDDVFIIPKSCEVLFLNSLKPSKDSKAEAKELAADLKKTFTVGVTKCNYIKFFHNVLWYEEVSIQQNIKKYNMTGVRLKVQRYGGSICYVLFVPGLAEKRPSLMIGDLLYIKPHKQKEVMFEAFVKDVTENVALIGGIKNSFSRYYSSDALFDVRFFMCRISLERMHHAVHNVKAEGHESKIFPIANENVEPPKEIVNYFNPLVEANLEQRCAVEHIVAGTSGAAPYLLHGPPGTGKTVTIVETVLQLVLKDPTNRIMVCTDSNMAADHVASLLCNYSHMFESENWLLRANSKYRTWETIPEKLANFSNGTSRHTWHHVSVDDFMTYRIVITTLSHAAMFAKNMRTRQFPNHITHLFIDEAAQASEPACLIPVGGMLKRNGSLILAGDPYQLGPVVISQDAKNYGLGLSLMERLIRDCELYSDSRNDPNYIVMLRNNFRSHPDILQIPDSLFYKGKLIALAKEDSISNVDILGEKDHSHAIVFHGVISKEQKIGKSPSFFNMIECDVVRLYVKNLVTKHKVSMDEIGVVTPYIRQVYHIKNSLRDAGYDKIEVGTVESFQGKEKRIIIVSTVRANCNLLAYDAKFQLGFLVDNKRFNVAITRAKAKCIIVGNPLCLQKDIKWCMYMERCRELGTYHGFDYTSIDKDIYSKEIFENLAPMLQAINVDVKEKIEEDTEKTETPAVDSTSVPVAVESSGEENEEIPIEQ